ncbi:MAG: type II secretion system protein [Verrucomicrobiota bacterium]
MNSLSENKMERNRLRAGMTVIEVMIVLVIIAILAGMLFPLTGALRVKAEKAKCISHMRSLHGSLEGFMGEHGGWPQVPAGIDSEEDNAKFWIAVTTPYGASPEIWMCPTHQREIRTQEVALREAGGEDYETPEAVISYVPTPFDPTPFRPYEWNQPWLMEKADNHGGGGHVIMPDGAVKSVKDFFFE